MLDTGINKDKYEIYEMLKSIQKSRLKHNYMLLYDMSHYGCLNDETLKQINSELREFLKTL